MRMMSKDGKSSSIVRPWSWDEWGNAHDHAREEPLAKSTVTKYIEDPIEYEQSKGMAFVNHHTLH